MTGRQDDFSHLDSAGRATADIARNPRLTVNLVVGAGILLAWLSLAAMAVRAAEGRAAGIGAPGDALLKTLPQLPLPDSVPGSSPSASRPRPWTEISARAPVR